MKTTIFDGREDVILREKTTVADEDAQRKKSDGEKTSSQEKSQEKGDAMEFAMDESHGCRTIRCRT